MSTKKTGFPKARSRREITKVLGRWLNKAAEGLTPNTSPILSRPSSPALSRYKVIPLLFHQPARVPVTQCPIVYDSSAGGQLIGLRDAANGHIRRVRFEVGNLEIEVVAERRDKAWEFVARVYRAGEVIHGFILRAGCRKLLADAGGFYHWTSETVPRHLRLLSFEQEVACEVMPW